VRSAHQASVDEVSVVFTRVCPRFMVSAATSCRQAEGGCEPTTPAKTIPEAKAKLSAKEEQSERERLLEEAPSSIETR